MKKNLLLSTVATALAISSVASASSFSDVSDEYWAKDVIENWANYEIIQGYPDGTYLPENLITRAEFSTLMVRLFSPENLADLSSYTDAVAGSWYYENLAKAVALGAIKPVSETTMRPNAYVTRQDAVTMINNVLGLKASASVNLAEIFSDFDEISEEAEDSVSAFVERGYLIGYPDGSFKPTKIITRAEAATIFDRVIAALITKNGDIVDLKNSDDTVIIKATDVIVENGNNVKAVFVNADAKASVKGLTDAQVAEAVLVNESGAKTEPTPTTPTTPEKPEKTSTTKRTSGGGGGGGSSSSTTKTAVIEITKNGDIYVLSRNGVSASDGNKLTIIAAGKNILSGVKVAEDTIIDNLEAVAKELDVATVIATIDALYNEDANVNAWGLEVIKSLLTTEEKIDTLGDENYDPEHVIKSVYDIVTAKGYATDAEILAKALEILEATYGNTYSDAKLNNVVTYDYVLSMLNSIGK